MLLVEEYFNGEDDRFVGALREVHSPKALAGLADRWKKDPRPWARRQQSAYLSEPFDSFGHNVVVKRLFKHAEATDDGELLARFLVSFDRLVRRVRKTQYRYDWQSRESWQEEYLAMPSNSLPPDKTITVKDPRTGRERQVPVFIPRQGFLFSSKTRLYLRRRAWRYFRKLGFQCPERYVPAVVRALKLYRDEDLQYGENILDSWGLLQACFRYSHVLEFRPVHIRLREDRGLNELEPAPRFPELWKKPEAAGELWSLVAEAQSRLVRLWAMQMLKREHAGRLAEMSAAEILVLLNHDDEEVQQFAADLLAACADELARLPVSTWLKLLQTKSLIALQRITDLMARHVSAERLELADCIRLASAEPAPVARLGLEMLKQRRIATAEDREAIAAVSQARSAAVAGELAAWALRILGAAETYERDLVLRFFDSLSRPVRLTAWAWLTSGDSPGYDDPGLWCRLLETPYDEIRLNLVDELDRRSSLPGAGADDLSPVWCSVLLGVHRGGRQKLKAVHQVSEALARNPARAADLLPVLAVSVRSVRPAETRAGLAAVVAAVEARPELGPMVAEHLPELKLTVAEAKP